MSLKKASRYSFMNLNTLKHILGLLEGLKWALGPSSMLLLSIKGLSNAKNLLQLVSLITRTTKIDPVSSNYRHWTHSKCARRVRISTRPLYNFDAVSYSKTRLNGLEVAICIVCYYYCLNTMIQLVYKNNELELL